MAQIEERRSESCRWTIKLEEFDLDIQHRKGRKSADVDGITRTPPPPNDTYGGIHIEGLYDTPNTHNNSEVSLTGPVQQHRKEVSLTGPIHQHRKEVSLTGPIQQHRKEVSLTGPVHQQREQESLTGPVH